MQISSCCLSFVLHLTAVSVARTQQIFNPINNLPPPGQSGFRATSEQIPRFTPPPSGQSSRRTTRFSQFSATSFTVPPPPIQQGSRSLRQVISDAVERVRSEDAIMRNRVTQGIDRYTREVPTVDPLLFSESPENATAFSVQCRRINWISRLLKRYRITQSLTSVLSSPEAARFSIQCPFVPPRNCDAGTRYRTVDGTCNNIGSPLRGAAFTPFERLLPAVYESNSDRDDQPQSRGRNGSPLRSAREISTSFHLPPLDVGDDSRFTVLLTVFGQFLAHDVTDRAPTKGYQETVLKCCNQRTPTPSGVCDNIPIPVRDVFRQFKGDCLEFARSAEVTDINCRSGIREQLNQASSYIDGGSVYGATKEKADSLRTFSEGLLMTSMPNQLPIQPPDNPEASARGFAFYAVGDNRVNEFIGLIGMETIWVREHNRIAKKLFEFNRNWSDNIIFQETRRIVIAMIQHIVYSEYLPVVLGQELMQSFSLNVLTRGFYNGYNSQVETGLTNSFATVAMRFGHSMLPPFYTLRDRFNANSGDGVIQLRDSFFQPQQFLMNQNPFMRGMAQDPSKVCDRVFSDGIINNLYETLPGTGSDLAAANIQRGRDHGLPSYADIRRHFTMPVPQRFDSSLLGFPHHDEDTIRKLHSLYSSPEDVEQFVAAISEVPISDGAVGPTIGHILAQQFKNLKEGDRFWYETPSQPQGFIAEQLAEIRKVTLARILCNTYDFEMIQPNAFLIPNSGRNREVRCADIPSVDLSLWMA